MGHSIGKKLCLVNIDPQESFITGSLAIPGADEDMNRVSKMVNKNSGEIDDIFISMDSHYGSHIANSRSWVDKKGNNPEPIFLYKGNKIPTSLTLDMVDNGDFRARNPKFQGRYRDYVQKLEENGRYDLTIWPDHCIIGSIGQTIHPGFLKAVSEWELKWYALAMRIPKGSNPFTEHYSVVRADVEDPADPTTRLNERFIRLLKLYDTILIAGEALSHCLSFTLRDIFNEFGVDQIKKFVLLKDATSNVPGCEQQGQDFIDKFSAAPYNMQVTTTTSFF